MCRIKDYILPGDSHSMEMSVMVSTSVMPSKELHLHAADILRDYLVNLGDDESQSVRNGCGSSWGNVGSNPTGGPGEAQYLLCSDDPFLRFYGLPDLFSKNQNAGYAAGYFLCLTTHHRNISTVAPSSIHAGRFGVPLHLRLCTGLRRCDGRFDSFPLLWVFRHGVQGDPGTRFFYYSWFSRHETLEHPIYHNHHGGSADLRSFHTHLSFGPSSFSSWGGEILRDMQAPVHQRPVEPCRSGGVNPCSNSTSPHSLSYGDINDETARTKTSKVLCCPCRG